MTERQAMERALELALEGWGRVAPNPLVGAVLLRDGIVVGEGFHAEFGGAHAEVAALQQCGDPRGATCVLNLEPCTHDAKTPPCTDALIGAGVRRVVYAVPDPDPVAGGGGERLKAAGIEVAWGLQRERAAALNAPFLWARCRADLPFVAVKVATSLDGFLADSDGRSRWISSEESRDWVHWLRAGFDALAVGRHTAVTDDPALTVRGSVAPRIPPIRVVFAGGGEPAGRSDAAGDGQRSALHDIRAHRSNRADAGGIGRDGRHRASGGRPGQGAAHAARGRDRVGPG